MEAKELIAVVTGTLSVVGSVVALVLNMLRYKSSTSGDQKIEPLELENHKLILELEYDLDMVIPYLWSNETNGLDDIHTKKLQQMKMLLYIKIYTWMTAMHQVILLYRRQKNMITNKTLLDMHDKAIKLYEKVFLEGGGSPILMRKFSKWHSGRVISTAEHLKSLDGHPYLIYLKNDIKNLVAYQEQVINMGFDAYFVTFRDTMISAQNTLSQLNGDIDKDIKDWAPLETVEFKRFNDIIIKEIQGWTLI